MAVTRGRPHAERASGSWFHAAAFICTLAAGCCRAAQVILDDFSPRIQYNTPILPETTCRYQPDNAACDGHWWFEHDDTRGSYENHTVHTTYGPGTTATLEFTGTSVALYGIVLQQYGAHAVVTLDGARSSFDCNATGLPDGTLLTKQLLFSKAELDPSVSHKIVVSYDDSTFDPANRAWLSIDYFLIDEQPLPTHTSTTAAPAGVASELGSSSTALNLSGLPSASGSSSPKINHIIGGVVGGLAVLIFGVLIALLIRRRRQRRRRHRFSDASSRQFLTPYMYVVSPARDRTATPSFAPSPFADDPRLSLVTTVLPPYTPGPPSVGCGDSSVKR